MHTVCPKYFVGVVRDTSLVYSPLQVLAAKVARAAPAALFAGPPMPSLVLLWPALPGAALVALVRAAFHYGGGHLARRLAARLHGSQWREKLRPNAAEDFAERIFYAVGHTLCTVIGGWVCLRNGWLTGPGELFFTLPFPHELPPEQVRVNGLGFGSPAAATGAGAP